MKNKSHIENFILVKIAISLFMKIKKIFRGVINNHPSDGLLVDHDA
jgi:hypothetical protein